MRPYSLYWSILIILATQIVQFQSIFSFYLIIVAANINKIKIDQFNEYGVQYGISLVNVLGVSIITLSPSRMSTRCLKNVFFISVSSMPKPWTGSICRVWAYLSWQLYNNIKVRTQDAVSRRSCSQLLCKLFSSKPSDFCSCWDIITELFSVKVMKLVEGETTLFYPSSIPRA